jgi:site-specific recombinase XerD
LENGLILEANLATVERGLVDLRRQRKAEATLIAYGCDLRRIAKYVSGLGMRFEDLTKHNLVDLLEAVEVNEYGRKLSDGRIRGLFSALNSLLESLEYRDVIETNPVPAFRKRYLAAYKRNPNSGVPRFCPTNEQVAAVIAGSSTIRDKAIHILLAKTGLRNKEVRELDVSDVNLVEKYIMAKPTAKRTGRKLPIDDECTVHISRWLHDRQYFDRAEEESALFLNDLGRRIGRNTLLRIVNRDGERQGLHDRDADILDVDKRYTPHVYRHWMTTVLRDAGCSERVIRYIRGDAEGSIADRYDHLRWETIQMEYAISMVTIL